ncbi:sensor histidine kinase [Paenibacillus pabuli]|uniref:sensor histidine kinase n=1 Tax=Paenibacillus pabuli TaxID=1472 RepID=UPI001FFED4CC|nr:histidine kinase [Paenibacillus pabuli]UPK43443.1 sensor histidine kinase [Paenibacillus pabuli]
MPMRLLQYGLLLVPAVLYILVLPMEQEDSYTLYIIIALGLAVWKDFTRSGMQRLLLMAEILFSCWLIARYGPFMFFLSLSALYVYMYRLDGAQRWLTLAIQLIASNIALHWYYSPPQGLLPWLTLHTNTAVPFTFTQETIARVAVNLLLLVAVALSWQGSRTANSREQLEQVYDKLRSKHYELQDARAQLLQFTKHLEGAAQVEERTRISRQLHDDIGHRLIRTKMMSEAALLTLPIHLEQGTEMVRQIRDQLAASMDDMRTTLHKLRPTSYISDAYALDRLLEDVGRETGVKTCYEVRGHSHVLYPSMQMVLYKNAKEALTNALRHGNATTITVELEFGEREICMAISNDGKIHTPSTKEQTKGKYEGSRANPRIKTESSELGMGLEGMRLRTQLIGGKLEIKPDYPYTVITRLPMTNKAELI